MIGNNPIGRTPKETILLAYDQVILQRRRYAERETGFQPDEDLIAEFTTQAANAFMAYIGPDGNPIDQNIERAILMLFGQCIEAIEELRKLNVGTKRNKHKIHIAGMHVDKARMLLISKIDKLL